MCRRILSVLAFLMVFASAIVLAWTGTINVWDFSRPASWVAEEHSIFRQFEKEHPGVKINFTQVSWANGGTKLAVAVAGGVPPALAMSANFGYIKEGVVVPINSYISKSLLNDYFPAALKTFEYKGKIWAWPQYMVRGAIYLNLKYFKERGVTPPQNGIWTWKQFVQDAKKLTFYNPRIHAKVWGFAFNPQSEGWSMTQIDNVMLLERNNKGKWIFGYNTPTGIAALKRLWDLIHVYKVSPPNTGGFSSDGNTWTMFTQRRAAMTIQWGWAISALRSYNKSIAEGKTKGASPIDFTVADYPIGTTGKAMSGIAGVGSWMVFAKSTQNPEKRALVMQLASMLAGPEFQESPAFRSEGVFPTLKSAAGIWKNDKLMSRLSHVSGEVVEQYPNANASKIESMFTKEFQLILLNRISLKKGIEIVAREIKPFLNQ